MLSAADVSVQDVLRYFTRREIEVGLLVPTSTGMAKGIMDATENVRDFLRSAGLHDYDLQPQGSGHKRKLRTRIVTSSGLIDTTTSLYRPVTKSGDPRLWIYGLPQHAEPGNLLVLVAMGRDELLVINGSNAGLIPGVSPPFHSRLQIRDLSGIDLDALLAPLTRKQNEAAIDLLELLRAFSGRWNQGLPGARRDTEVGRLLEELLGIKANSSRSPDYRGIEIKAGRNRSRTRQTLFARVPDWSISHLKSSSSILDAFGYQRGTKYSKQLRCTVSARAANTQGLYLVVPSGGDRLMESSTNSGIPNVVAWRMHSLMEALQQKHPETFWVTASTRQNAGREEFRYDHVLHTKRPMIGALPTLLETGAITVDHLITRTVEGRVREQGPLFKIWRKDMDLLFPPGYFYSLLPDPSP